MITIQEINNDCLGQIFRQLSQAEVFACGQVNQKWRTITRHPRFLNAQFPHLRTDALPMLAPNGFVNLALAYRQTANNHDLKKLSLKKCVAMTDSALEKLTIRTPSLSIKHCPKITSKGLSTLFSNLVSPARIRVSRGTAIEVHEIFQECVKRSLYLQKLDLRKATFEKECSVNTLAHQSFIVLLRNNLLQSPCHLDLRKEGWVNGDVLNSLKTQSVAFSFLGISFPKNLSASDRYCDLIAALNFTRPCEIRSNVKFDDQLLLQIIKKNLLLKSLNLESDVKPKLLCTTFESHLASSCQLKLSAGAFTPENVEILIRKQITIDHLHLKDDVQFYTDLNLIALSTLFQHVPIKSLYIECGVLLSNNLNQFIESLKGLKNNVNPPRAITIKNFHSLKKEHFLTLSKAGLFKGNNFSLAIEGEWIDTEVMECLASVSTLTFKKFQCLGNGRYYDLSSLFAKNSFEQCTSFLSGFGGALSRSFCYDTPVKKLHLSLSSVHMRSKTIAFLLNPRCFTQLHTLTVSEINNQDFSAFALEILKVRPHLFLRHLSAEQPTIDVELEVD